MKLADYIPFYKRNLHLALPVVLSQVGQISVHLIDNMMVGHVGTPELAAASFANNVFMIGMYFGMGITYGITPLIGNAFSKGDTDEVAQLLKNGYFTHTLAAFVLSLCMFGVYFLLPYFGQPSDVLDLAQPYFLYLCFSYIPFMFFFSFKQVYEGFGNTGYAMKVTLIANLVNVIINYLFIFGKWGMPQMGLDGAGLGTLVARLLMPVMFVMYSIKGAEYHNYFLNARKAKLQVQRIYKILKIGIPIGFQIIVEVLAFGIGAVMMGWLGEVELAAHQVALGLASFTYMVSLGISQANTIRVSHQMGQGDLVSLKKASLASTHLVLVFMMLMGLVFVFFREPLASLFTNDPVVVSLASQLLIIAAIFQVFDGLQVIMLSTLRGMADVKLPMMMAIIAYLFVGLPTSYLLTFVFQLGAPGIWYGFLVGLGTAGVLFLSRFHYLLKLNTKKRVIH